MARTAASSRASARRTSSLSPVHAREVEAATVDCIATCLNLGLFPQGLLELDATGVTRFPKFLQLRRGSPHGGVNRRLTPRAQTSPLAPWPRPRDSAGRRYRR